MSNKNAIVCFLLGIGVALAGTAIWRQLKPATHGLRQALLQNPEFLADNPDILQAARDVLQTRALAGAARSRSKIIRDKWATALLPAFAPTLGDAKATSVLIEFTDYTCVPCKSSAFVINQMLTDSPHIRVVLMFVPIGGAVAEYAARVAYAAYQQNPQKFAAFHQTLMDEKQPLTQQIVLDAASRTGFDVSQIEEEVGVQETRSYLEKSSMLATDLNIVGVPAFVLNGEMIIGGLTPSKLKQLLGKSVMVDAI